jgi:hypothetical protein
MDVSEPVVAGCVGTGMSTREGGDWSVEMLADAADRDSLPAASDNDKETCLEGDSDREKEHRGVNELGIDEDSDEEAWRRTKTVAQHLFSLPRVFRLPKPAHCAQLAKLRTSVFIH